MNKVQYEYRKVGLLGGVSLSIVLPKDYALRLGVREHDIVKVSLDRERIIVEKV